MHRLACRWLLLLLLGCGQESAHPDAPPAGSAFACGTATCDARTQFCYSFSAGVAPTIGCNALPAACGASPGCACVTASFAPTDCAGALSCTEQEGQVHVTCTGI